MSTNTTGKVGRPAKVVRWSVDLAAKEFGSDRRTISKALGNAGIPPGEDGKWSTRDIVSAIFGDREAAELRVTVAKAEQLERRNRVAAGELVEVAAVIRFNEELAAALRERVMALDIPHATKEAMLGELRKLDDEHEQRRQFAENQEENAEGVDAAAEADPDGVG